ncbi:MAG: cation-translocating P-type ATPase [Lachnospiraceae bacterium]|nr:cation-translocating P-type ATPase [Lachnospiraceae bacterium]
MFEKCSVQETVLELNSDEQKGLTDGEAFRRLQANGKNELKGSHKKTMLETFVEQLMDPLIYVLLAAAVVSVFLQEISDAIIITIVIMVNAIVGMVQEGKARRALEFLKKLTSPKAIVIREGRKSEVLASELVKGDLVYLEAGCQVPADIRLVEGANLKVEESALTGESLPVEKDAGFLARGAKEITLGDRRNMVYMSTMVTYGRATGLVTATGMDTEIGKIAAMITEEKEELTPLQKRLGELGKYLSILSLILCAALFAIAVFQKRNIFEMLITAISLAVAAVPEGLPAVVTICLALSVTKMVKVNTIIRRLPSVETLGAVSVVCSDKTGTLTQNRMTVEKCWCNDKILTVEQLKQNYQRNMDFVRGMVLCNDASVEGDNRIGDPTELALLDMAARLHITKAELAREYNRCGEKAFDSDRKMMTTCHRMSGEKYVSFTKGAPDEVLKKCTYICVNQEIVQLSEAKRRQILKMVEELSLEALRTLAVAMRKNSRQPVEEQLIFLGMVGMKDPARPEAAEAVEIFKQAGVSTVMITGDHVDTAYAIGKQLGIVTHMEQCMTGECLQHMEDSEFLESLHKTRVFARVSPAQKVRIVKGFQQSGQIVAMTGDGINDAPSLRAADIGIAMGMTGTDVAKQAADMILTDDNFATIEKAIEEGRGVYENIRKSVIFLLSSNMGEILTMFLAVLMGMASPLKSSHILWINLITDSLPALALGMDRNDGKSLMKNPPRKAQESLFARGGFACTCFYGVLIAIISLTAFLMIPCTILKVENLPINLEYLSIVLKQEVILAKAQTYAFTVLGMSQLFHAIGMRDVHKSFFLMRPGDNWLMVFACIIGFVLQFAVTEVPFLIQAFGTSHLSGNEWMHLIVLAACPLFAHECIVFLTKREQPNS